MHYVSVEGLTKSYGITPLFSNITFHIEEGDKIALVARNGSGKSTLLKILAGKETADEGKCWINKDVDIALFEQEPGFDESKTILDNIFQHNHPVINAIKEYEAISEANDTDKLSDAIVKMDELGAWDSVRVGGDAELIERINALGNSATQVYRPLMVCLDNELGLTNHPELGLVAENGNRLALRIDYKKAFTDWHKTSSSKKMSVFSKTRLFEAPKAILVEQSTINFFASQMKTKEDLQCGTSF
jgi:ATPase subunit of ABC transporter with duplicated ATPase domains